MSSEGKTIDLISRRSYRVRKTVIKIPLVKMIRGENENEEQNFWRDAQLFVRTPQELMSELDDAGLDFEKISDYELFLMLLMSAASAEKRRCMLFENFDLFGLSLCGKQLINKDSRETIIDEETYHEISDVVCAMICHEKPKKPTFGNEYAKQMRIRLDREKKKRQKIKESGKGGSMLGGVILRLVCSPAFPYDFKTVNDITVYELLMAVKQIDKEKSVDGLLQTALVGNDLTKVPQERLNRYVM